ncbi:phosphomannomutase [Meinhardsimonia xiamenensis]|uniref:Phosphomannomutase n=1 Tax=Meinhardsimonia xiamenensis TaxID=990712 RepID=A0A1G9AJU8_9RHOB|nr:phosphomannomutase [Meinhardsimonia xiamenensis]PRX35349.1 phosphomannomutase [Meinhardsimonia xiamenensis]SDK27629.1 phosphomannomutase [Meinhardsimonia xiamenensis]
MNAPLPAFKSYDIRGRVGRDLDAPLARAVGQAFSEILGARRVVLGHDARASSPALAHALAEGAMAAGSEVLELGLCGTEEVYFATDHLGADGGLMVTGSHNPIEDNGIKMVREGARPVSRESGLAEIEARTAELLARPAPPPPAAGTRRRVDPRPAYVARVLSFIEPARLKGFRLLANPGNGAAGPTFAALAEALAAAGAQLEIETIQAAPDPSFPNGIPNPLLPEKRDATAAAVRATGADIGIAWDGDFDRCFLFDETGGFIDGEYIVGLLARAMLARHPGARIVHDPRVMWNTQRVVAEAGGEAVVSRTGHALIKAKMREVDAVYGGEMSAHHYFRDFMYCDSGMIPWLQVLAVMAETGRPLSDLVAEMRARHPSSGEINFRLADPAAAMAAVEAQFGAEAEETDRLDGLSMSFSNWRFNLRASNTEPVLRLNVEALGDAALVARKVEEIRAVIAGAGS